MSTAKLYTTGSRRIYESFVGDVIRPQSPARKRARENCSTNAPARGWCWRTRDPACTSFTASAQRMRPLKLRRPSNKGGMIDVTTDNAEEASTNLAGHSAPAAAAVRLTGYTICLVVRMHFCGSECASKTTPPVDRTRLVMAARMIAFDFPCLDV